ncbi:acetate--CoA ligase family protein [Neobacillus mesonae]|uniref:acetate--CoA ligase family protein n=1 Tax=Neobacillus mesonae TaxID=1193713 RepID=UPI00203D8C41|nr:acetate--CoA ligase family protein [Neobacillus mesonae]MCM3567495.1 acetate--CoA ligase family protein [Neobacillus mesonae]
MRIEEINQIIQLTRANKSLAIPEVFSKKIFESIGMNIPEQGLAGSEDEAVYLAEVIGYPVVLKVHSFKISHKSDANGVLLGIKNSNEVRKGFREIVKNTCQYLPANHQVQVSVQKMAEPGTEVIIGMKRDPIFGPAILFGLGGVWVEVMKDAALRVSPLREKDVDEMISEIKGSRLLGDYRGAKPRDIDALKTIIFQVERLALEYPEISEIDLNPVFLYEEGKGAVVVDARIIMAPMKMNEKGVVQQ